MFSNIFYKILIETINYNISARLLSEQSDLFANIFPSCTRCTLSRRDIKQVEERWLCPSRRQLYLPLGGQTWVWPHRWWCQLLDLGLPLSYWRPQGHLLRTYWGVTHMQERYKYIWQIYLIVCLVCFIQCFACCMQLSVCTSCMLNQMYFYILSQ